MRYKILRRTAGGIIVVLGMVLLLSACGSTSGQSSSSPTEVQIALSEFTIDSSQTTFTTGTPYRFVIKNEGTIPHNWAIMPRGETDESHALVKVGADQLPPGATVTQDFTFTQTGDFEFACHLPGHYEAGMFLHITVQQ